MVASETAAIVLILVSGVFALLFALHYALEVAKIKITGDSRTSYTSKNLNRENAPLVENGSYEDEDVIAKKIKRIYEAISIGAQAFLMKEYEYMAVFIVIFSIFLICVIGATHGWLNGVFTAISFVVGAVTSILAGYVGMRIAVFSNARTTMRARESFNAAFQTAFKAGSVMGFSLVGMGLLNLFILITCVKFHYSNAGKEGSVEETKSMYEAIAGYGLGGSSVALFARVGGGIYTKAADVGADLAKIKHNLDEDSPQNPAVIADNVGDNVGDIAGMGADLFGSFAESSCAAMIIAAQSELSVDIYASYSVLCFPLILIASGVLVCVVTSFFATCGSVNNKREIEPMLKRQIIVSTVLMTPVAFGVCKYFFPASGFTLGPKEHPIENVHYYDIFACIACGLWSGLIIGITTEYYTSNAYFPVKELAESCKSGASTNIIYGLALGYKSVIIPTFCMAFTIYVSYSRAGMYGIANAALGILSTLATGLTIDAYGPICDNAGGIAEMAGLDSVRSITDALDAAGNTTAAIGKGFAIGSAALVSLALFGAYVTTVGLSQVDILEPAQFSGLLVGAMLPYWFTAMTMKSVGMAALAMDREVTRQFEANPALLDPNQDVMPDYVTCVAISTDASLREMIPPGLLVMLSPIIVGFLFGTKALAGLLAGSLVSGVQIAISASNTGGAWDNAKKYIEDNQLGPDHAKHSATHKAAVVGDTVGDPLKDTSGPALNILVKLSAIISLVLAPAIKDIGGTAGLLSKIF